MFEDLTLITCSYNTPEITLTMLKSFVYYHKQFSDHFNILLMENSTNNKTKELLDENNIPYIRSVGLTHSLGVNEAIKICETKYCLLIDTDIIFKQPIVKLYEKMKLNDFAIIGEYSKDRGGYKLKPRINPWFCMIDVEKINSCNIRFHSQERIESTNSVGFFGNIPINNNRSNEEMYDVGSTFYEDIVKNHLKIAIAKNIRELFVHYEGSSWQIESGHIGYMQLGQQVRNSYLKNIETFKEVSIKNVFIKPKKIKNKIVFIQPIFCPNDFYFKINLKSLKSFIDYKKRFDSNIQIIVGGYCFKQNYWDDFQKILPDGAIIHKFDRNYGKGYVVNELYSMYADKSIPYMLTCDSDIIFDTKEDNIFERLIKISEHFKKYKNQLSLFSLNQNDDNCHDWNFLTQELNIENEKICFGQNGGGIAGGCIFLSTEIWKKVKGYRVMGVYCGDDGFLNLDIFKNGGFVGVTKSISIIHPNHKNEDKDYTLWKVHKIRNNAISNNYENELNDVENYWRNKNLLNNKGKVDVAINVHKRPIASYLALKSLIRNCENDIDRIYFIDDNHELVDYSNILNDVDLKYHLEYFKPKYNFWTNPINLQKIEDEEYRHSIRYQYAIEKTDKEFLFIMHDDIVVNGNIIKDLRDNIGDCIGIGEIGQCWNCPAKKLGKCVSEKFEEYKPSYEELFEMYSSDLPPRWKNCLGKYFQQFPWPLPECRLNEYACLININKNNFKEFPFFGTVTQVDNLILDTATGWFRKNIYKGYKFKHFDIYKDIYHEKGGHGTFFNNEDYEKREEKCKYILKERYNGTI